MKTSQKIIKGLAIALAIFIIVSIVELIFSIVTMFIPSGNNLSDDLVTTELVLDDKYEIDELNIIVSSGTIKIETGEFGFKTNNSKITAHFYANRFVIEDERKYSINDSNTEVVITIPESYVFNSSTIKTGAGSLTIKELNAKTLNLDVAAGKTNIKSLSISDSMNLETGAGQFTIKNGEINSLNASFGVGQIRYEGILTGKNTIETGMGEVDVKLKDSIDNYTFKTEKGIGEIRINGDKTSNGTKGSGSTELSIEGGIGSININTK